MSHAGTTRDNERSWAIDLISRINTKAAAAGGERMIRHAGGELGLSTGKGSLFPDVLLFGDTGKTNVLQGWELKYPDTPIDDKEFYDNAVQKAELLGVNSFLLWNVAVARLYMKNEATGRFAVLKEWDSLRHVTRRDEVVRHAAEIQGMLDAVLNELEYYFRNGTLKTEKILNSIVNDKMLSLAFGNLEACARALQAASAADGDFSDEAVLWWETEGASYGKKADKWIELSKLAIVSLMNKLIFSNILKKYNSGASAIDEIGGAASMEQWLDIFRRISERCDFYNILEEKFGERYIDRDTMRVLAGFNDYLLKLDFNRYSDKLLEELLGQVVTRSKRKVAGQFSTPRELAVFLAALTMGDKSARVLDPCCGTGTIVKAAYDLKTVSGIEPQEAIGQIWAGDKFRYPLQFAMLALSSPENIGKPIHIFKEDVFQLGPDRQVLLHGPAGQGAYAAELGPVDVVLSNLPFVQQETLGDLNPEATAFIETLQKKFNGRSDLYAYIALKLEELLAPGGTAGLIVSNSWLGTEFGSAFFEELRTRFIVKYVVTSGKGRWFKNADVVANIIVLQKGAAPAEHKVRFITLQEDLERLIGRGDKAEQIENAAKLAAKIRRNVASDAYVSHSYSYEDIDRLDELGIVKNALFADCEWLLDFKDGLVPLGDYFLVKRGERRGWNALYYPQGHRIEPEYIVPVMKKLDTSSYIMDLDASIDGFCCSRTIEELEELGHEGALAWIRRFEHERDGTGELLRISKATKHLFWYEMSLKSSFDIGLLINPDERLFFSKAPRPVFFDQRLTGLVRIDDTAELDLLAALLNSLMGVYYIEAIGFGRGLGVLDLNKNKVEDRLKMLNPALIGDRDRRDILELYRPLETRRVLPLPDELEQDDRFRFDMRVLTAYGLEKHYDKIKQSLLQLFAIRKSVRD